MHTFEHDGVTFFHNNDIRSTADVYIQVDGQGVRVDVPQQALVTFVAQLVADERISQLEQAEPLEVFGLDKGVSRAEYAQMVRQRDIMRTALQCALEAFAVLREGRWEKPQHARDFAERARLDLAVALLEARK